MTTHNRAVHLGPAVPGERQAARSRVAVLSPHLDDAVLSVGSGMASMARRGVEVLVITVLAGDPDSQAPAGRWDRETGFRTAGEAARARREEDRLACEVLGVTPTWFPYRDEQYPRGGSDQEIAERLRAILADVDAILAPGFPLQHQDHAWLAGLALSLVLPNVRVGLYSEQPYMERRGWPSWSGRIGYPAIASSTWYPLPATAKDRREKRAAREAYGSQLAGISRAFDRDWPAQRRRMDVVEWSMGGELVAWLSPAGEAWEPASPPAWVPPGAWAMTRGWMWRNRRWARPAVRLARSIRDRRRRPPPVGPVPFGEGPAEQRGARTDPDTE